MRVCNSHSKCERADEGDVGETILYEHYEQQSNTDLRSRGSTFGEPVTRYNIIDFVAALPIAVRIPFGIATPTKEENAVVHYLLYCFSALPQHVLLKRKLEGFTLSTP